MMHDFKVRVLNGRGRPSVILVGPHASVLEALQTARSVSFPGDILEVWRDDDRVHKEIFSATQVLA
jgi:hypothetical protein